MDLGATRLHARAARLRALPGGGGLRRAARRTGSTSCPRARKRKAAAAEARDLARPAAPGRRCCSSAGRAPGIWGGLWTFPEVRRTSGRTADASSAADHARATPRSSTASRISGCASSRFSAACAQTARAGSRDGSGWTSTTPVQRGGAGAGAARCCQAWPTGRSRSTSALQDLEALAPSSSSSSFCLAAPRQRQHLGQARADPGARIEARAALDQLGGARSTIRRARARKGRACASTGASASSGEQLDVGEHQAVGLHAPLEDAKALLAPRDDLQEPELLHVPLRDARQAAHVLGRRRRADFARLRGSGRRRTGVPSRRQALAISR